MNVQAGRADLSGTGSGESAARAVELAYIAVVGIVLLLMMLFGLTMRATQAQYLGVQPRLFYVLLTMHGAGMVGIAGMAGAVVMWHFVRRHVPVSTAVFAANLVLFLIGAVLILGSGFLGGFAGAWTFLYPLPAHSMGIWSANAAAAFMLGYLAIGVGFLLFHLDVLRGIWRTYGSLANGLGLKQAIGLAPEKTGPPVAVPAATMSSIVNILGIVAGAVVLILSLVNLYVPSFTMNALVAKNLIYFFGHTFINATIYMAIIAVYEILPRYAHHPWNTNRIFYLAWVLSTVLVLIIYPHHLLMDFAMPPWAAMIGQIIGYISGLPVLLVTAFGTLTVVYRSGLKWDVPSGLCFVGVLGWAAGVIPAIADGTIVVNSVMHNTQWVPGHFHTYLLLGVVAMFLGYMTWTAKEVPEESIGIQPGAFWLYVGGGIIFVVAFLAAGSASVPRRYAVHLAPWLIYDRIGTIGAVLVVLGVGIMVLGFLLRVPALARLQTPASAEAAAE
ncbi:MAG: cbb3-type cytochrome c oxidase subunit I [Acetobacteraceae bacterium]